MVAVDPCSACAVVAPHVALHCPAYISSVTYNDEERLKFAQDASFADYACDSREKDGYCGPEYDRFAGWPCVLPLVTRAGESLRLDDSPGHHRCHLPSG